MRKGNSPRNTTTSGSPESHCASDELLRRELRALGRDHRITAIRHLSHGPAADTWLISYADGTRAAGKTATAPPAGLFEVEAEGLAALRATGCLRTPDVLAVTGRLLLLEALAERDDDPRCWERFAHDLASLHRGTIQDRFGWPRDGFLGRLPQVNTYTASGHEFFAEHRLLRYLGEPLARQALTAADRRALERLCDRLPEIIPAMPPVLTHGDLWSANLLSQGSQGRDEGRITVIDPAVSFTWAEVDLSMLWCSPRPPASDRFFELYQELNPSPPGWTERMPVLNLRELLSTIAHFSEAPTAIQQVRRILAPFY